MKRMLTVLGIFLTVSAPVLSGRNSGPAETRVTIVVGFKIDTNGSLLTQTIILMMCDGGFDVVDKFHTNRRPASMVKSRRSIRGVWLGYTPKPPSER